MRSSSWDDQHRAPPHALGRQNRWNEIGGGASGGKAEARRRLQSADCLVIFLPPGPVEGRCQSAFYGTTTHHRSLLRRQKQPAESMRTAKRVYGRAREGGEKETPTSDVQGKKSLFSELPTLRSTLRSTYENSGGGDDDEDDNDDGERGSLAGLPG